jgi:putative transposase
MALRLAIAQAKGIAFMRRTGATHSLSYPLRLPDEAQANALRLLDVSREVINEVVTTLWARLDEFGTHETKFAYEQVEEMTVSPQPHGHRQWRCEAEQAGRILRGQAQRKKQFSLILPILSQGMIEPKTEQKRAGKNRKAIKQALAELREDNSDGGNAVELQSLIEQACNFYLANGCFPDTYEEMQAGPVQQAAVLPYAGDDGANLGQAYRMSLDLEQKQVTLAIRYPDEQGVWSRTWREQTMQMALPDLVIARLKEGQALAPTLREIREPDGTRYAVLDLIVEVPVTEPVEWADIQYVLGWDWGVRTLATAAIVDLNGHYVGHPFFLDTGGFDGRQAHTRRHIDQLKAKVAKLEARRDGFPEGDLRREPSVRKLAVLRREIDRCWRKYEARNNDLAHLAANILLLLATAFDCQLIVGESLKSLKSTARGRGAKSKWLNWRNNSQIRGDLWRVLRYKCFLAGIRLEWQQPKETSHRCPHCGKSVETYRSPEHLDKAVDWGAWLTCPSCGWNGARDYTAALNIARLGATFITHSLLTGRYYHTSIAAEAVKPVSYIGAGLALRLPPTSPRGRLTESGKLYCNGWIRSVTLHSSYTTNIMLRFCG